MIVREKRSSQATPAGIAKNTMAQAKAAAVPVWGFEQSRPRSVVYEVTNRNAFDAFDVRAEYNGDKSYELGDMPMDHPRASTSLNQRSGVGCKRI